MRKMIAVFLILFPFDGFSYEIEVHKEIMNAAFDVAARENTFSSRLVLGPKMSVVKRRAREGVTHADDWPWPVNHFFDVQAGMPLSIGVAGLCTTVAERADHWGLESQPVNFFGLPEAREHYVKFITGKDAATRDEHLGLLFESLGQIAHLIQDMAQPEHTRNDQHRFGNPVPSLYEKWSMGFLLPTGPDDREDRSLFYSGYPTVKLPRYADYFHSDQRKGLADFSGMNFVTQDTNYHDRGGCFEHPRPSIRDARERFEVVSERVYNEDNDGFETVVVMEVIYTSQPWDSYTQRAEADLYHTFHSAVDLETKKYDPTTTVYSLADASFLSRAAMLIPRAVGYSAGFIDHFFRGQIEARWQKNPDSTYNLIITNRSPDRIGPDAVITASYKVSDGSDLVSIVNAPIFNLVPLSEFAEGLSPGASLVIPNLAIPSLAGDSVNRYERRIAIRGKLGAEADDVIGLVQPANQYSKFRVEVTSSSEINWFLKTNQGYGRLPLDYLKPHPVLEVDITPGTWYQVFAWNTNTYREGIYSGAQIRIYGDGKLIDQATVSLDAWDHVYMGPFPEGAYPTFIRSILKQDGCRIYPQFVCAVVRVDPLPPFVPPAE